jgi:hypothetical protein
MKDSTKISRRDMFAASVALGLQPCLHGQRPPAEPAPPFVPSDPPNSPMGAGKGIYPGRVVWAHRPEATRWDGITEPLAVKKATGEWWDDANCDPKIAAEMVSTSLKGLTGKKTEKEAWDALFRHFNRTRNFPDAGYKRGEKISIKINFNNDRSNTVPWPTGRGMPSPQVAHALLRQLVHRVRRHRRPLHRRPGLQPDQSRSGCQAP